MKEITIDVSEQRAPTRDAPPTQALPNGLPEAKAIKQKSGATGEQNGSLFFVGNATTVIEWEGVRVMTDPNFLHAGDHVHLGPGVTAERLTDPAVDLHDLPRIDVVLLSHYHEDHFDKFVEDSLRRDLPIITTKHAQQCLQSKGPQDSFTNVHAVDAFENLLLNLSNGSGRTDKKPAIKVAGMPGKHVPPGPIAAMDDILKIIPPTNGWMVELGYTTGAGEFQNGYRIYISGDTLMVDDLKEIPERYKGQNIDLMLAHLGGTTIPSPKLPLLMVTMDAKQGIELIRLIQPDVTIPVHFDDYSVFASPISDFVKAVEEAGWTERVVYLDRGDKYAFQVVNH